MTLKLERKVFIGSSTEGRTIADIVSKVLRSSNRESNIYQLEPCLWEYANWQLNYSTLDSLMKFPKTYDYSIFIFVPDDTVISRKENSTRVRDNVLFEFGLFVSQEDGMKKAFVIHPKGDKNFVLASDLTGINTATYVHSSDTEILRNRINEGVKTIVDAIANFEKTKVERSERAVKTSIMELKEAYVAATNESERSQLIINALRRLVELKSQVLNQSPSNVLYDILSWTNTLLDVVDPNELTELQSRKLEKVWVYSERPIEFNKNARNGLCKKFKKVVVQNLSKGVHYTYFVDSDELVKEAVALGDQFPKLVDVCIFDAHCITCNYAIHFYTDKTCSVFQNIVRKGNLELLVRLDNGDAQMVVSKISGQFKKYKREELGGIGLYKHT